MPEVEASLSAGALLENLGLVWKKATLEEKHQLLAGMVEAIYVDLARTKRVVGIRPRPSFRPVFAAIQKTPRAGSPVRYGGDGGESNPASSESRPGVSYRHSRYLESRLVLSLPAGTHHASQ